MTDPRILEEARQAAQNAYVPYSHFPVAAILELRDGTLLSGCNVENASYGLCMCAERNVLFMSVACGVPREDITSLTVYAPTDTLTTPCGACRQVMTELLEPETPVIVTNGRLEKRYTVRELLPDAFEIE
ncbi:cytidine deaminase [uncultured Faecalibaculum sp.]|uniref:cytidine deaminase n=1 Tax=uncultured Faecalibaculum sp. TaxID=1729681 RepID=UPI0025DCC24A|nr:cytidine deaminase [uncultured Faecalibaculum sp.]